MYLLHNIHDLRAVATDEVVTLDYMKKVADKRTFPNRKIPLIQLNFDLFREYGIDEPEKVAFDALGEGAGRLNYCYTLGLKTEYMNVMLGRIISLLAFPGLAFLPTNLDTVNVQIMRRKGHVVYKRVKDLKERAITLFGIHANKITQKTFLNALVYFGNYIHLVAPQYFNFEVMFVKILTGEAGVDEELQRCAKLHNGIIENVINEADREFFDGDADTENSPFVKFIMMKGTGLVKSKGEGEGAYWAVLEEIKLIPRDNRTPLQILKDKHIVEVLLSLKDKGPTHKELEYDDHTIFNYEQGGHDFSVIIPSIVETAEQIDLDPNVFANAVNNSTEEIDMDTEDNVKTSRVGMKMFEGTTKAEFKIWRDENEKYFVKEKNVVMNRQTKKQAIMTNVDDQLFEKYILAPQNIRDDLGKFMAEVQMVGCLRELDIGLKSTILEKRSLFVKDGKVKKKTITFKNVKYEETLEAIPIATGTGVVMLLRKNIHEFFRQCMIAWQGDNDYKPTRKYLEGRIQNSIIRTGVYQNCFYPRYNDSVAQELKDNNTLCMYSGNGNIKRHTNFGIQSSGILNGIAKAREVLPGQYQTAAINALKKRITNDNQQKLMEYHVQKTPMPAGVIKGLFRSFFVIPPVQNNMFRSGIYMKKLFFSPYGHYISFLNYYLDQTTVVLNAEKNVLWKDIEYLIMTSFYQDDLGVVEAGLGKKFKRSDISAFITEEIKPVTDEEFGKIKYIPPLKTSGNVSNRARGQVYPILKAAVKRKIVGESSIFEPDFKLAKANIQGGFDSYESIFKKLMKDVEEEIKNPKEMCGWVNDKVVKVVPIGEFFSSDYKPKRVVDMEAE